MSQLTTDFDAGGQPLFSPFSATFKPLEYSWDVLGGPRKATIRMTGPEQVLWQATNMLKWGVTIRSRTQPRWWGFVAEVAVQVGGLEWIVTLDSMANRVKVIYTKHTVVDGQDQSERAETEWASDTNSINVFGVRENKATLSDATPEAADAYRNTLLAYGRNPMPKILLAQGQGGASQASATLVCRGWWDLLRWRYVAANGLQDGITVSDKLQAYLTTYGQMLTGVTHLDRSTILSSVYATGDNNAQDEVEDLLRYGTATAARLRATVLPDRRVEIAAEPLSGDQDYLIGRDGTLRNQFDQLIDPSVCPVGVWARLKDVIPVAAVNSRLIDASRVFIESCDYDAQSDTITPYARGVPTVWDIGSLL